MKSLRQFIEDFIDASPIPNGATPANTIGMGCISICQPDSGEINSEPLYFNKPQKRKKPKKYSLVQMIKEIS